MVEIDISICLQCEFLVTLIVSRRLTRPERLYQYVSGPHEYVSGHTASCARGDLHEEVDALFAALPHAVARTFLCHGIDGRACCYLEVTIELMFAALVVAASKGFMSLMNSVDGDSATEMTSWSRILNESA